MLETSEESFYPLIKPWKKSQQTEFSGPGREQLFVQSRDQEADFRADRQALIREIVGVEKQIRGPETGDEAKAALRHQARDHAGLLRHGVCGGHAVGL